MNPAPMETLHAFLSRLSLRYGALKPHGEERLSLLFAEGLLRKRLEKGGEVRHWVVIGPTQAGKSTVVNLLLGGDFAGVSPLAGFTRHARGFFPSPWGSFVAESTAHLLPHLEQAEPAQLTSERLDRYALIAVDEASSVIKERPMVVWDTPDFDSVSARDYRYAVPALCALADRLVLVVSREKYADRTVWEMLRMIAPAGIPLVVVLNKTDGATEGQLVAALTHKFEQEGMMSPPICPLPYMADTSLSALGASVGVARLLRCLADPREERAGTTPSLYPLLSVHWPPWVTPLRHEHAAASGWGTATDVAINRLAECYERDYLRNPDYRETFEHAMARLLDLLEIPGLAEPMGRARDMLTWPARQLTRWLRGRLPSALDTPSPETQVLHESLDRLLLDLQRLAGERAILGPAEDRPWWQVCWHQLQREQDRVRDMGREMIAGHQAAFQPEIDAAALRLYQHLQAHPALLNTLRATRATADVAAVVLALKSGGIGLHDLFLTPAMLSFASMLTEGAIGQYLRTVEKELKLAQAVSVRTHLLQPMAQRLVDLARYLPAEGIFGIPSDELHEAEEALGRLAP